MDSIQSVPKDRVKKCIGLDDMLGHRGMIASMELATDKLLESRDLDLPGAADDLFDAMEHISDARGFQSNLLERKIDFISINDDITNFRQELKRNLTRVENFDLSEKIFDMVKTLLRNIDNTEGDLVDLITECITS